MESILKKILKSKLVLFLLPILIGGGIFFGLKVFSKRVGEVPAYQITRVERGTIVSAVTASGTVLSANLIPITTEASGVIKNVYVNEGDEVSGGQKILDITLDQDGEKALIEAHSRYISAKNSLESAKSRLYTLENTLREEENDFEEIKETTSYQTEEEIDAYHTAENEYLVAKSNYELQESEIEEARLSLENARVSYEALLPEVTAPTSGVITGISYIAGMRLSSEEKTSGARKGQTVASIKTGGNPLISVNVSEIDIPLLKVGQKATVTLDSLPDKTFTGEVVTVDRVGSVSSGVSNYPVIIQLDTDSKEVLSHMAATAEIIIERKSDVLTLLSSAVQTQDGEYLVRVLRDNRPQLVPVEIGLESLSQTEIISGLSLGEEVITGVPSTGGSEEGGRSPFGGGGMFRMMR